MGSICLALGFLLGLAGLELRTSWFQSRVLAAAARRVEFTLETGPSQAIHYPGVGPYDRRLGYSSLKNFLDRLDAAGYDIEAQARSSKFSLGLTDWGAFPIYPEKTQAGLRVLDRHGFPLFEARYPQRIYTDFESIPPAVLETLLYIENRELLNPDLPFRNPAVEWDRLTRAVLGLGLRTLYPAYETIGASTLATQLEKIRHSPDGITVSVGEKFRQMLSASLRAYQAGENTLEAQRRIIRDYINSIPLAGIAGYGEVTGLGDGLWAWFGADFKTVNNLLAGNDAAFDGMALTERAVAYRQVLTLLLALRRPSSYLLSDREEVRTRTDHYLHLLCEDGIISTRLRDLALQARPEIRRQAPLTESFSMAQRKAASSLRASVSGLLGLGSAYDLDRLDLTVSTSLEEQTQAEITEALVRLKDDPSYAAKAGVMGRRLLSRGDPESVIYSFTVYERGSGVNLLRIQSDNFEQPLNINEGTKLELGSTAKLRTLVTYLEVINDLHKRYSHMPDEELSATWASAPEPLTRWAARYLFQREDKDLEWMMEAALHRRYSASPGETFFTGGGLHYFQNFDSDDNGRVMTVREAFRRSVNLVFIRLMRDIVRYYTYRAPGVSPEILRDKNNPLRQHYLARFADREGRHFMADFYRKYRERRSEDPLEVLLSRIRPSPKRLAVIYRSVRPEEPVEDFIAFLRSQLPHTRLSDEKIAALYESYGRERYSLADRAYLARVHPLELWLVAHLSRNPGTTLKEAFEASTEQRQDAYQWLFRNRHKHAQDKRIRIQLEADAFQAIHLVWKRQGYPFERLIPSYATAIGSSGDRPAALAELIGIMLNDGVRYPSIRVRRLHFGEGTPMETIVAPRTPPAERSFSPTLARVIRQELVGVVQGGTGRRARGAIVLSDGTKVDVGGKTGTGDNRFETFGAGAQILNSRVINRTATFVFLIGNRLYGAVTAFVPGEAAARYRFTSALPVQVFKHLAPALIPLLEQPGEVPFEPQLKLTQRKEPSSDYESEDWTAHAIQPDEPVEGESWFRVQPAEPKHWFSFQPTEPQTPADNQPDEREPWFKVKPAEPKTWFEVPSAGSEPQEEKPVESQPLLDAPPTEPEPSLEFNTPESPAQP